LRMLQAEEPNTYIPAAGRTETVRGFVTMARKAAEIDIASEGGGEEERGAILEVTPGPFVMPHQRVRERGLALTHLHLKCPSPTPRGSRSAPP